MKYNQDSYLCEKMKTQFGYPRVVYVFIIIIAISAIAMMAMAYQNDEYTSVFELKEMALVNMWCRVFGSIFIISCSLLFLWLVRTSINAVICSSSLVVSKKIERIKKDGDSPVQLTINEDSLRMLFSDSFTDDKFEAFCRALRENQSALKKCDIGKLAERIMYHSPYCSDDARYKKTRQYEKVWNFTPFCKDFYSAVGITSSIYDLNYFTKSPLATMDLFSAIIDDDSNSM